MQSLQHINYEVQQSIAFITVNRPEVRNAMLTQSWMELNLCAEAAADDKNVRAIILTGAGEKAFIAGGDVHNLKKRTPLDQLNHPISLQVTQTFENMEKPVIAAINGAAVGGGFELALACDIRIGSSQAKFILPELGLGILPGAGGTQRLVRTAGLGRAKELIMAGKIFTAQEAYLSGLLMEVVEPERLMSRAVEIATEITKKSPVAMAVVKKILNHALDADLSSGLLAEQLGFMVLLSSEDRAEGMSAFLEKRQPKFQGK